MSAFGQFYLDKEKDIIIALDMTAQGLRYTLRTPNHAKGNLITNLARVCSLPVRRTNVFSPSLPTSKAR